jgi:hypothetical protein
MFFCKSISYTCDLQLKLDILNPLNIFFCQMVKKMSFFHYNPFPQNFKTLKFYYDFSFHQVHPMNIYFHRKSMFLLYKRFEINCMTLCIPFDSFKKKCNLKSFKYKSFLLGTALMNTPKEVYQGMV